MELFDYRALVGTLAYRGVAEGRDCLLVNVEESPCIFGRALQDDNLECAHEEESVCLFIVFGTAVVIYFGVLEVLVLRRVSFGANYVQEPNELAAKTVGLRQVERAEVFVEWFVAQILLQFYSRNKRAYVVYAEEERFVLRSRRTLIRYPVELV